MSDVKLNFAITCDYAIADANGKVSLIGIFSRINAEGVPTVHSNFYLVVNTYGRPGEYVEKVEFINLNDSAVIASAEKAMEIKPKGKNTFIYNFVNLIFPEYGKYWFKISVGETVLTSADVHHVAVEKA